MQQSFIRFKGKLEHTGSEGEGDNTIDHYEPPYDAEYRIEINGKVLSFAMIMHNPKTDELYIPNEDLEILPNKDYRCKFKATEMQDFKLLKGRYKEV